MCAKEALVALIVSRETAAADKLHELGLSALIRRAEAAGTRRVVEVFVALYPFLLLAYFYHTLCIVATGQARCLRPFAAMMTLGAIRTATRLRPHVAAALLLDHIEHPRIRRARFELPIGLAVLRDDGGA